MKNYTSAREPRRWRNTWVVKPLRSWPAAALLILLNMAVAAFRSRAADSWHIELGPLMTQWAAEVSPTNAWPEYPRPQMVRPDWQNLNGLWDFAILPADAERPKEYE